MNEIRQYNGYFMFAEISEEKFNHISKLFSDENLEVDLSRRSLEFESTGRDTGRLVSMLFKKLAQVLENADGELRCEIDNEQVDPHFEFFSIRQGELILQRGRVVRDKETFVM